MMQDNCDLSWDDLCVNPHDVFLREGRSEGRQAGLEAGFEDGYTTGRTTAVEYGLELGFIKAFVQNALTSSKDEKVIKTCHDLQRLVSQFPSPDEIFVETTAILQSIETNIMDDSERRQSNVNEGVDLRANIQAVRARFKLLTVQLGMPHFSLKNIMDEAAKELQQQKDGTSNAIVDQEW